MNQTALNYLTKVLGVKEVLCEQKPSLKSIAVCCSLSESMNEAETELFWKMMAAIKLSSSDVILSDRFDDTEASIFIHMDSQAEKSGGWSSDDGRETLRTLHPKVLLQKPELKREAWEHLKEVMRRLNRE